MNYWSVTYSFKWNNLSLTKYPTINMTGNSGNDMDKFIKYKILANTLILKFNKNAFQ